MSEKKKKKTSKKETSEKSLKQIKPAAGKKTAKSSATSKKQSTENAAKIKRTTAAPKARKNEKKKPDLKHDDKFEMGTGNEKPIIINANGKERKIKPPTAPHARRVKVKSIRVHYEFND